MSYISPLINLDIPEEDEVYKLTDILKFKGGIQLKDSSQIKYSIVIQDEEGKLLTEVIPETEAIEYTAFEQDFIVDSQLLNGKIIVTVKDLDHIVPYVFTNEMVDGGILGEGKVFSGLVDKSKYVEILGLQVL